MTLLAWNHPGTLSGTYYKPSDYTPATIAVETTATRFNVSVRYTFSGYGCTGIGIIRATGVVP